MRQALWQDVLNGASSRAKASLLLDRLLVNLISGSTFIVLGVRVSFREQGPAASSSSKGQTSRKAGTQSQGPVAVRVRLRGTCVRQPGCRKDVRCRPRGRYSKESFGDSRG